MAEEGLYTLEVAFDTSSAEKGVKDLEKLMNGFTADSEQDSKKLGKTIRGETEKTVKKQKAAQKDLTKAIKKERDKLIKGAKGDGKEELKIRELTNRRLLAAEKQHSKQVQKIRGQSARGRAQNRFQEASQSAGGGLMGTMRGVSAAAGPAGMAVGAAFAGVAAVFSRASQEAQKVEDSIIRVKTLLTDAQAAAMPSAMNVLRQASAETGKSISEELLPSLYNVISAVPALANNLEAAAQITTQAAQTGLALGASTDAITLAATNMGNALGMNLESVSDQNKIFDILANTMKQGVIPSGEAMASAIAKAAPEFRALTSNAEEGINTIGAMTAMMTANGVSMDESQTKMRALALELLDTTTRQELMNAGLKGFDPETGKVDDWTELIRSAGDDVEGFAAKLGSTEAQGALRILAQEGGEAFAGLMQSMEDSGGTAQTMFETAAQSGEVASARLDTAIDNLYASIGTGSAGVLTATKSLGADVINWFGSVFQSAADKADQAKAQVETLKTEYDSLRATVSEIPTTDELIALDVAKLDLLVAYREELGAIGDRLTELNEQERSFWSSAVGYMGDYARGAAAVFTLGATEITGVGENVSGGINSLASELNTSLTTQIGDVTTHLDQVKLAWDAADAAGDDNARALLSQERQALEIELMSLQGRNQEMESLTLEQAQRELEVMQESALLRGEEFNMSNALLIVTDNLSQVASEQPEIYSRVVDQLRAQADINETRINAENNINDILVAQGITESSTTDEKLAALMAAKAGNDTEIQQLNIQIEQAKAMLQLGRAKIELLNAQIRGQNELNKASGAEETLRGAEIVASNLDAVIGQGEARVAQLMAENDAIDSQIAGVNELRASNEAAAGAAGTGAGGGSGGGASTQAQQQETQRIQREQEQAAENARKAQEQREQRAHQRRMDDIAEKSALELEMTQEAIDLAAQKRDAEKRALEHQERLADQLQNLQSKFAEAIDNFRSNALGNFGDVVSQFINPLQQEIYRVDQELERYTQLVADYEGSQEEALQNIATLESETTTLEAQFSRLSTALEEPMLTIYQATNEAERLGRVIEDLEDADGESTAVPRSYLNAVETAESNLADSSADLALSYGRTTEWIDRLWAAVRDVTTSGSITLGNTTTQLSTETRPSVSSAQFESFQSQLTTIFESAVTTAQARVSNYSGAVDNSGSIRAAELSQASQQSTVDATELIQAELEGQRVEITARLDEISDETDRLRVITGATGTALEDMAGEEPLAQLSRVVDLLGYVFEERQKIADLEQQATASTDYEERARLLEEVAAATLELATNMDKAGGAAQSAAGFEAELTREARNLYNTVEESSQSLADASESELANFYAIKPLLVEIADIRGRSAAFAEDTDQLSELMIQKELQLLEYRKETGYFNGNELEFLQQKAALIDENIALQVQFFNDELITEQELMNAQIERYQLQQQILELQAAETQEVEAPDQAELKKAEDQAKAEMKGKVAVVMGAINSVIQGIADLEPLFARLMDDSVSTGDKLAETGQKAADIAGEITGLPIGEMFAAVLNLGDAIAGVVDMIIAKHDDVYQSQLKQTEVMEDGLELHEEKLRLLDIEIEKQERIFNMWKAQNDEAAEQLATTADNAEETKELLLDLFNSLPNEIQVGIGPLAFDDPEELANQIAAMQGEAARLRDAAQKDRDRIATAGRFGLSKEDERNREASAKHNDALAGVLDGMVDSASEFFDYQVAINELEIERIKNNGELLDTLYDMGFTGNELLQIMQQLSDADSDSITTLTRSTLLRDKEIKAQKVLLKLSADDQLYWNKKLDIANELYEKALEQYAAGLIEQDELLGYLGDVFSINESILKLKEDQNAEDEEANANQERLRELHRERQALIMQARAGILPNEGEERVNSIEAEVIRLMTESGATQEAIDAALQGFATASYAVGTSSVPQDQVANVHKGERIFSNTDNKSLIAAVNEAVMKAEQYAQPTLGRYWDMRDGGGSSGDLNIGDIIISITGDDYGSDQELSDKIGDSVYSRIQDLHSEWHTQNGTGNGR